jgi:hypothetical protein
MMVISSKTSYMNFLSEKALFLGIASRDLKGLIIFNQIMIQEKALFIGIRLNQPKKYNLINQK